MKLLIIACALLAAKAAKLEGYTSQVPSSGVAPLSSLLNLDSTTPAGQGPFAGQSSVSSGTHVSASSGPVQQSLSGQQSHVSSIGGNQFAQQTGGESTISDHVSGHAHGSTKPCPQGQIRHVDGTCVTPEITRNVFVYAAPEQESEEISLPENIPLPKIEHNIVFIRTQDGGNGQDPIIVPPPQRKNIIYVLNKESELGQQVIEVPSHPAQNPEVYFVNYGDGETPTLPDGIDFETALNSAIHAEGQVIGGAHGLSATDGGSTFVTETGSGSLSVSGTSSAGATGIVTGSGVSGGSFTSSAGNIQTTGATFPIANNIIGGTSDSSSISQPLVSGAGIPQSLYSTP